MNLQLKVYLTSKLPIFSDSGRYSDKQDWNPQGKTDLPLNKVPISEGVGGALIYIRSGIQRLGIGTKETWERLWFPEAR